jgi:hypothetical protein
MEHAMSIEGQWFLQPGDIQAPFVFALTLHPGGRAEWQGEKGKVEPYRVEDGELIIGADDKDRYRFTLDNPDAQILMGVQEAWAEADPFRIEGDEDDKELEDFEAGYLTETVALLRSPGDLPISDY